MRWDSDLARVPFRTIDSGRFGRRQKRPRAERIPVIVITGFLGAGKTTLLRHLLGTPAGRNSAVVVNEFGAVGIDDALLAESADTTVLLGNGCLCCTVRSDLDQAMRKLIADRQRGLVPAFERVIVETSGLADPVPILQTFASDRALGGMFHVDAVVAVVDASGSAASLTEHPEAGSQLAVADRIVLSKSDLAGDAAAVRMLTAVRALNQRAALAHAIEGRIDPAFLLAEAPADFAGAMLGDAAAHTPDVGSFVLRFAEPFDWAALSTGVDALIRLRGPDLLRVKGLVAVAGCRGPVVLQIVRHIAHPPVELQDWPGGDRTTRIVFIGRALDRAATASLFDAVRSLAAASTQETGS